MEKDYPGPDRRDNLRYNLKCPSDYIIRFGLTGTNEFQTSLSGNIGLGGILLLSSVLFEMEDVIDIEISYQSRGQDVKATFLGKIIWVEEKNIEVDNEKKYFFGVQFENVTDEQNSILVDFIEKYIMINPGDEELIV